MNIGFDAKRYFHNSTGLGNYSRTLVNGLARFYPQHQYFLFNPKPSGKYSIPAPLPLLEVLPQSFLGRQLPSLWRSRGVVKELKRNNIHLYHGLSHEIPIGMGKSGIPSLVSVHDLIFERFPKQYGTYEVIMHRRKIQYACRHADAVIAISQQTKRDLVELYKVPEKKIQVCYQSCDPAFGNRAELSRINAIKKAYQLPDKFFLYVGSIIERKNLLRICEGINLRTHHIEQPLVVVGSGGDYAEKVKAFVREKNLGGQVIFMSERRPMDVALDVKKTENLAALYQMATALVYPSFFEGFGIPVLEALWSRIPVITSNISCLPETGGNAALYIDPANAAEIGAAMVQLQNESSLRNELIAKGLKQAQKFSLEHCAGEVMKVYTNIVQHGSL